jgi:hypothetical protein
MRSSAGFHAQLTGILAGLAFASIVLILERRPSVARGTEAGILSFFSTLIVLLIAAFLYGTVAGEEVVAGRAALLVFLAGFATAIAVLNLLYGLAWLVRAGGFLNAAEMVARITALIAPLLTFCYLAITALNEITITAGQDGPGSGVFVFFSVESMLLGFVLVLIQIRWRSAALRRLSTWLTARLGPEPWLSFISVGGGLISAVCGAIVLRLDPDVASPGWLLCAVLTVWLAFSLVVVLLVHAIDLDGAARRKSSAGDPSD